MRILALLGVTFSIVALAVAYLAEIEREKNLASAYANVRADAERIASEQAGLSNFAEQFLEQLIQTHDFPAFARSPDCQPLLAQIVAQEPRLANVVVASPEGAVLCDAREKMPAFNLADRSYFQKTLNSKDLVTGGPLLGRSVQRWGLPYAKAIRDKNGRVKAVAVALLDFAWVNRELAAHTHSLEGRVGLVSANGIVLARSPDAEQWVGRSAAETTFFKKLVETGGVGTAEAPGFDNVSRIYGFAHFAETEDGPVYLWVGVNKEAVTAAPNRKFWWTVITILSILGLSFIVIWVGSERLIFTPVSHLADTARRLAAGDHNARTGLAHGDDELGRLAQAFDGMAMSLMSNNKILALNRALRVLSHGNQALVHSASQQELLHEVCKGLVEIGNYRFAWVGMAEQDEHQRVTPAVWFGEHADYLESVKISWADNDQGRGPTGTAIRSGQTQVNQNFVSNPVMAPWREKALSHGFAASIALPLKDEKGPFGALTIYSQDADAFDHEEVVLLEELAGDLAFGVRM